MTWRVIPPAHSALRVAAIAAGAVAAVTGSGAGRSRISAVLLQRTGAAVVRLTDSGTAALTLALRIAMQQRPGRVIALPAFSCFDLVSAALGAGAPVVFYDLDSRTLAPDVLSLATVAASKPAGIVLVHAFGVPVDVHSVRHIVGEDTMLIEDCAQAWGSTVGGDPVGRQGDAAVFSFGRGKGITGGGGGALVLQHAALAAGIPDAPESGRGLRDSVACAALWLLSRPEIYALPARMPMLRLGETRYHPPRAIGALSDAAATTLACSIDAVDHAARQRGATAHTYRTALAGVASTLLVDVMTTAVPGWLRFPLLATSADSRDRIVAEGRSLGVAASYPKPLPELWHELTGGREAPTSYPGATALSTRLLTAPTHELVRERDVRAIIKLLTSG